MSAEWVLPLCTMQDNTGRMRKLQFKSSDCTVSFVLPEPPDNLKAFGCLTKCLWWLDVRGRQLIFPLATGQLTVSRAAVVSRLLSHTHSFRIINFSYSRHFSHFSLSELIVWDRGYCRLFDGFSPSFIFCGNEVSFRNSCRINWTNGTF